MKTKERTRQEVQSPALWPVLAAVTLGFAVVQLDVSVVNVAVKAISAGLGGGVTAGQWVVDAYTLTFAAFILSAGALGDRIGARRVLLGGFGLFTVASVACGAAPSIGVLVAARAVQGIGAAALGACSLALLNHSYPGAAARARAIGFWAAGGSAGMAAGPVLGGLLIAAAGWRLIFFINVPLGVAGYWLTARHARETPRARDRGVDLPGQVTAIVALAALAGATIETGVPGTNRLAVAAGFGVAAIAGAAFVLVERSRRRPMLPLSLFRSRAFTVTAVTGLLINVVFYGLYFSFSLFLQRQDRLSPLTTGLAFLPATLAVMTSNFVSGRAVRFLDARWAIACGALLMAAGCGGLLGTTSGPVAVTVVAFSMTALGIGLIVPVITTALLGSVDPAWSGIASGTLTAMRQTGSVLGVALFGSLLADHGAAGGLRMACIVAAGLAVAVIGLSLGVPGRSTEPSR